MAKKSTVLGLMSGTSMDGVDAALLETDGLSAGTRLATGFTPYPDDVRDALRDAVEFTGRNGLSGDAGGRIALAAALVTDWHITAINALRARIDTPIDLIGFHGQTIFHDPAGGRTCQIGDARKIADVTGIPVIHDFRTQDMREGGQGAPLMPLYHQALAIDAGLDFPACVLNLGGVGNITWMDGTRVFACDTGPANALIDDWMLKMTGTAIDRDGAHALRGTPDMARVGQWMNHPFFAAPAPKSLDRNAFAMCSVDDMTTDDGAATLAAFTVASVHAALALMPAPARRLVVAGGGRHNAAIMRGLQARIDTIGADTLGWSGDHLEAQGFAWLAARVRAGLFTSLPTTTGCRAPTCGGMLAVPVQQTGPCREASA